MRGLPALREAVAAYYGRRQGLALSPDQVVVTSGATEAIAASLLALIAPGDEVVLIQPLYDAYLPLVLRAGGVPRLASLTPPGWRMTEEALAAAFTPTHPARHLQQSRTIPPRACSTATSWRCSPISASATTRSCCPTRSGRSWSSTDAAHIPLASLPGMAERVVKVGSAGKIFSLTGWKVGWAVAPPDLAETIAKAHQFVTFTTAPNLQAAVAYGLGKEDGYFADMRAAFADRARADAGRAGGGRLCSAARRGHLFHDPRSRRLRHRARRPRLLRARGRARRASPRSRSRRSMPRTRSTRRSALCFAKTDATIDAGVERLAAARRLFAA